MKEMLYLKKIILLLITTTLICGCSNANEVTKLQQENSQLKSKIEELSSQTEDFRNRLAKYEVIPQKSSNVPNLEEDSPVKLQNISFDKDGVTGVSISFINTSPKTVDAIEFVILQFDNFGRPAYRFNDKSEGNVSSALLMQGNATTNNTLNSAWTLFNTERTVKGKVIIKQVHFTDGAVWNNLKFNEQVDREKESYE